MKQKATVVEKSDNVTVVRVSRKTMCDGCGRESCSGDCTALKLFGKSSEFEARAENSLGAEVGDTVTVETPDSVVNLSALLVFIVPIAIAFSTYFVMRFFLGEQISVLLAFSSLVLYFALLSFLEKRKKDLKPKLRITEIVESDENKDCKELP